MRFNGRCIQVSVFGQSHAEAVGAVAEGLPAGFRVDREALQAFLNRRAPGQGKHTTARKEAAASRAANEELKGQVESLSGQVAAGSVLKARGLSVAAYNASDKTTDRSSRVVRLLATLSLVENELAPRGPVRVYIRVKDPEGILLTNSAQTSFKYNGQTMVASASREVDYEGKEVELSIYLNDIPAYQSGIYSVEAYTAQSFLGKTELLLR